MDIVEYVDAKKIVVKYELDPESDEAITNFEMKEELNIH